MEFEPYREPIKPSEIWQVLWIFIWVPIAAVGTILNIFARSPIAKAGGDFLFTYARSMNYTGLILYEMYRRWKAVRITEHMEKSTLRIHVVVTIVEVGLIVFFMLNPGM